MLQVLLISVLFAFAVKLMGERGRPLARGVERVGEAVFGIVKLVMYLAPIGAFGAMAYTTGKFGLKTLTSLGAFVGEFWLTGIFFCLVVLGVVARLCGIRILRLYRYFSNELLITVATANYEAVIPQLIAKLERLGHPKRIVLLAATLSATGAVPIAGIMLIFGVDRIMSTMRGIVSFCGQTVASIVVSVWEGAFDRERAQAVLAPAEPRAEVTMGADR